MDTKLLALLTMVVSANFLGLIQACQSGVAAPHVRNVKNNEILGLNLPDLATPSRNSAEGTGRDQDEKYSKERIRHVKIGLANMTISSYDARAWTDESAAILTQKLTNSNGDLVNETILFEERSEIIRLWEETMSMNNHLRIKRNKTVFFEDGSEVVRPVMYSDAGWSDRTEQKTIQIVDPYLLADLVQPRSDGETVLSSS